MNRCPLTYLPCGDERYSIEGLKELDHRLSLLRDFPYSREEQLEIAAQMASKLSIQGVQPKLSTRLNVQQSTFEAVTTGGRFIFKPQHLLYPELPENEDVTMKMAEIAGIEVPLHGLIYCKDGSLTYFIKRFDRQGRSSKLATEDFSQLSSHSRLTKYDSSMEQIVKIVEKNCTFPLLEKIKLFRLTLFNFLVGNEDMHLKNFSVIQRQGKIELSPSYDLLNSTMATNSKEELALPLKGKKSNFQRQDFTEYFAIDRLQLTPKVIQNELDSLESAIPEWLALLEKSFLSLKLQERYRTLLLQRFHRLFL